MEHERKTPQHTALIIPDGRTRIYQKYLDEKTGKSQFENIPFPAKDVFIGRMSSICREYAEKFYPNHWFILSTNNNKDQHNKDQPMLVHPDQPILGDYDNPPYPIPPKYMKTRELRYWQPFDSTDVVKPQLLIEAKALGLLPSERGNIPKYTRIIFLGNYTDDDWWTQAAWDSAVPTDTDNLDEPIYSVFNKRQYEYSLYVNVIKSLFRDTGIWLEFPLHDCVTESEMVSRLSDALYRKLPLHRSPYSLQKITVINLFRMGNPDFTYTNLPLGHSSDVQIITAPNGYGKSTIFRLIRAIFLGNLQEIGSIPFECAKIILGGSEGPITLKIKKEYSDYPEKEEKFIISSRDASGREKTTQWFSFHNLSIVSGDEAGKNSWSRELGWVIPPVEIRFLSSERLFHDPLQQIYDQDLLSVKYEDPRDRDMSRTARYAKSLSDLLSIKYEDPRDRDMSRAARYAKSLSERIDGVLTDYAFMSHKGDMTFPVSFVKTLSEKKETKSSPEYKNLEKSFSELTEKRKQLENIDFLPFRQWYSNEINPFEILKQKNENLPVYYEFLELYLKNQTAKYNVFDWLNARCQKFEKIINNLLVFTRIRIQRDKGFSFYNLHESAGQYHELSLNEISSGEMHQVVMYYDFLFNCDPGTIVLIDEPEISLHVYAQSLFIDNIRKIAGRDCNSLQFIVATHSPTIIGDHWDITYDLLTGAYNEE